MGAAKELAKRASSTSTAALGLNVFVTSHDQRGRLLEASQQAVNNQLRQTIQQARRLGSFKSSVITWIAIILRGLFLCQNNVNADERQSCWSES